MKPIRVIVRSLANLMLPALYRLTSSCSSNRLQDAYAENEAPHLIVSLTSFPARIGKLWLVVESLMRQTHKPDKIILWLSREQFPNEEKDLPKSLLKLQERGLSIEFRDNDYRSHKKYYYTQVEYPNDIMVTVDDDIFYNTHLLERLWEEHIKHPEAIISNHSHQLQFAEDGTLASYEQWSFNSHATERLFFIGAGGNLFPPRSLHPDVTDIASARATCPAGDDIWLNAMAALQGTQIIHSSMRGFTGLPVINKSDVALCNANVMNGNGNDQQIAKLDKHFVERYGRVAFLPNK